MPFGGSLALDGKGCCCQYSLTVTANAECGTTRLYKVSITYTRPDGTKFTNHLTTEQKGVDKLDRPEPGDWVVAIHSDSGFYEDYKPVKVTVKSCEDALVVATLRFKLRHLDYSDDYGSWSGDMQHLVITAENQFAGCGWDSGSRTAFIYNTEDGVIPHCPDDNYYISSWYSGWLGTNIWLTTGHQSGPVPVWLRFLLTYDPVTDRVCIATMREIYVCTKYLNRCMGNSPFSEYVSALESGCLPATIVPVDPADLRTVRVYDKNGVVAGTMIPDYLHAYISVFIAGTVVPGYTDKATAPAVWLEADHPTWSGRLGTGIGLLGPYNIGNLADNPCTSEEVVPSATISLS